MLSSRIELWKPNFWKSSAQRFRLTRAFPIRLLKKCRVWTIWMTRRYGKRRGSRLSAEKSAQLEFLHFKRQREGLSETEARTLGELVQQYERAMLIRARAVAILKLRGHDLSGLAATS